MGVSDMPGPSEPSGPSVSGATPYYADDRVTLYLGDCREITEWLAADVLVTDPPYGTQAGDGSHKGGYGRRQLHDKGDGLGASIASDGTTDCRDEVLALWGSRPAVVFGSPRLPDPPGVWDDRLVWDKRRPGMNGGPFRYTHESIYARGMVRTRNDTFSVFSVVPNQRDHIHAKPVEVMERLLSTCPPGSIADPFAGSGSTLVAARNLGRKAIGVELEERYCEVIAKRLAQDCLDLGSVS